MRPERKPPPPNSRFFGRNFITWPKMAKIIKTNFHVKIFINLKLFFKFHKKKLKNKKTLFAQSWGIFAKMGHFRWFFEKNLQTNTTWPKMEVCIKFLQKMKIYILSFQTKKNLVPKTHLWRNGGLLKFGRNRRNFHLGPPGGPPKVKRGIFAVFRRFRPNFKGPPFRHKWVFGTNFLFVWKLRI